MRKYYKGLCFNKFYFIFSTEKYAFTVQRFRENSDLVGRVPHMLTSLKTAAIEEFVASRM